MQPELIDEAEVVVVGAGPAGSSCASRLATAGHDVLLVDQSAFPRDKPCGDGLTRSAVAGLARIGLSDLIDTRPPIEGLRMVFGFRSAEFRRYAAGPEPDAQARCIERQVLDARLLDLALGQGVRFRQGRVSRVAPDEAGPTVWVSSPTTSEERAIRARLVVACDGATSRLARQFGRSRRAEPAAAYAVRAYFRSELELEPVFDTYMPLELGDRRFPGYGWVFPVDAHLANVGIGYWQAPGVEAPPRIREVMRAFVEQLQTRGRGRFGDLEPTTRLFGSPLGVPFAPGRCEAPGVVFVGDAAGTTDPISGEGIAYALHGAELIAELVHRRIRGGGPRTHAGELLARRFPRLSQDIGLPLRMAQRRNHDVAGYREKTGAHPFIRAMRDTVTAPEVPPDLTGTVAGRAMVTAPARAWLQSVNERLLESVATSFPAATELLHGEVRSGVGPILSAVWWASGAGGDDDRQAIEAAVSLELIRAGMSVARWAVDRPATRGAQTNNAMCLLIGDFALSRAIRHAAAVRPEFTAATGAAIARICDAQFAESATRFDPARNDADLVAVRSARISLLLRLSLGSAGASTGASGERLGRLERFGDELGRAVHLTEDLAMLLIGDEALNRAAGTDLRFGAYSMPVLWAAAEDPLIRERLDGRLTETQLGEVIERTASCGALERAAAQVTAHVSSAKSQLRADDPSALADLADAVDAHARDLVRRA